MYIFQILSAAEKDFFFLSFFPFFHFQAILKVLAGGLPQPRCCCFCFFFSSKPHMTLLLAEIRSEWLGNVAERYSSTKSPCCGRLQIGKPENASLAASTRRPGRFVGSSTLASLPASQRGPCSSLQSSDGDEKSTLFPRSRSTNSSLAA